MAKNKHKDKKREHLDIAPLPDDAATAISRREDHDDSEGAPQRSTLLPKDFSLEDPKLPKAIEDAAMRSGGYPYDKRLKREEYEKQLLALQIELMKLQKHNLKVGNRILCLYEGRDGSGKGSCIKAFNEHMNPRNTRTVALPKPTETERGQLYFQRYAVHLPTSGEVVLFDRSWYNRAGVERVMGFCTEDQLAVFLREAPEFEGLLVRDGIKLFKFYLTIGREMQLVRFHERAQDPLKQWKLSPVDLASLRRYDDYTRAEVEMFRFTHTAIAPWIVVRANDQRRARLETIRHVLLAIEYEGRDLDAIGPHDPLIIGSGPEFFHPQLEKPSA
ncbi:MAG: polyphosphate kinase 2 [Proteobacteria bacterium]|nr:polyphosphate kinase 2 [Pseudomonadota bacterium]